MNRVDDTFYFEVDTNKVKFTAKYLKKIFAISSWLRNRYNISGTSAKYDMGPSRDVNKITIKIIFNGE